MNSYEISYQTGFIAKSSTIKGETIGPLSTTPPSCFNKLHREEERSGQSVKEVNFEPKIRIYLNWIIVARETSDCWAKITPEIITIDQVQR